MTARDVETLSTLANRGLATQHTVSSDNRGLNNTMSVVAAGDVGYYVWVSLIVIPLQTNNCTLAYELLIL